MTIRAAASLLFLWTAFHPVAAVAQVDSDDDHPVVAVVLGGGGAHAVAHIGVLEELERQRVRIDLIVGTGIGGVVGGLYASGMTTAEIREFFISTDWEDIFDPDTRREDLSYRRKRDDDDFLIKYRVGIKDGQAQLPSALVPNGKLAQLLQSSVAHTKGIQDFDDLPVAFRTVTMDLMTGEEVILDSGSLDRAMLATLTSPGTLPPVPIEGRLLVTGSLLNNFPIDVARQLSADVVIVSDMGPYLRKADEINSVFGIVGQVSNILQRRNSADSLATLREADIVVRPTVVPARETDFSALEERLAVGVASVTAVADRLATIRVSDSQYRDFMATRQKRRTADPVISEIVLNNDSDVDDALILAQLKQPLNAPLDKEQLDADMRKIYGIGAFQSVDFSLQPQGDNAVLHLRTIENRVGNRFWRFGVSLQDDLEGNSAYTGSASFTWTQINRLGAEWRNVLRIGEVQQVATEFYQPVDELGRYFVSALASFDERNTNSFEDGAIIDQSRVRRVLGQLAVGRIFGNSGEVRVGTVFGYGTTRSNIGSPFPSTEFDVGGVTASASYDTLDNIYFPNSGATASVGWTGLRDSMGATTDIDVVKGTIGSVKSWGPNSLIGSLKFQTQLKEVTGVENLLSTGGLFNMSGYQRDELSGRHTAVGRVIYYRQFRSNPVRGLLEASLYVGGSLELGNAWQNSSDVKFSNSLFAGSLFLGADTFIGPVYLAGGLAEGGHSALYLYIGRPF
jgi:NTE family protein